MMFIYFRCHDRSSQWVVNNLVNELKTVKLYFLLFGFIYEG